MGSLLIDFGLHRLESHTLILSIESLVAARLTSTSATWIFSHFLFHLLSRFSEHLFLLLSVDSLHFHFFLFLLAPLGLPFIFATLCAADAGLRKLLGTVSYLAYVSLG